MPVDWKTCEGGDSCIGVQVPDERLCLVHLFLAHGSQYPQHPDIIHQVSRSADFRGLTIDAALLAALLEGARSDGAAPTFDHALFTHATFTDAAAFDDVEFLGDTSFAYANFAGDAAFDDACFHDVTFRSASFAAATSFRDSTFVGPADFHDARFGGTTELAPLTLHAGADFSRALFEDTTRLSTFCCEQSITFQDARFRGLLELSITGETTNAIILDDVLCEGQVDARLSGATISVARSRFDRGGQLIVTRGDVTLQSRFARPMLVGGPDTLSTAQPPRVVSLLGSDLSGTTLAGFDLSEARFVGVHGLHGLRVDSTAFGTAPRRHFLATTRVVVADELDARGVSQPPDPHLPANHAEASAIYRAQRAGQESRKDEPGSADFYYGEMEMRRLAAPALSAERAILTAYGLLSGYGLRATRAAGSLAALLIASTIAFQALLVEDPPRLLRTLLFSVRTTVSFVREPRLDGMTIWGDYLQLGLRFAGPVLLALTVLAIRSRVRR